MWVRSPDYGNTLGASRKKRRDELVDGLGAALEQTGGGFDALARAERAAMQDKERKDATAYEREQDALARAERAAADSYNREQDALNRKERSERDAYQREQDALTRADQAAALEARALEAKTKAQTAADAKALEDARALLKRTVSGGIEEGLMPEEIVTRAREMPGLELISGDEEVLGEYRTQRQPERDALFDQDLKLALEREKAALKAKRGAGGAGGAVAPQSLKDQKTQAEIDLLRARTEAQQQAAKNAEQKREEADKKTLADIHEAEKMLAELDRIETDKKAGNFNTGPLADRVSDMAETVLPQVGPLDRSERSAWKARVARIYNAILKEQSGAAVTASEETRQLVAQLNTRMDDNTFDRVLQDLKRSYSRDIALARERLTGQRRADAPPAVDARAAEQIADQVLEEMPDASDEEIAAEVERRMRGG